MSVTIEFNGNQTPQQSSALKKFINYFSSSNHAARRGVPVSGSQAKVLKSTREQNSKLLKSCKPLLKGYNNRISTAREAVEKWKALDRDMGHFRNGKSLIEFEERLDALEGRFQAICIRGSQIKSYLDQIKAMSKSQREKALQSRALNFPARGAKKALIDVNYDLDKFNLEITSCLESKDVRSTCYVGIDLFEEVRAACEEEFGKFPNLPIPEIPINAFSVFINLRIPSEFIEENFNSLISELIGKVRRKIVVEVTENCRWRVKKHFADIDELLDRCLENWRQGRLAYEDELAEYIKSPNMTDDQDHINDKLTALRKEKDAELWLTYVQEMDQGVKKLFEEFQIHFCLEKMIFEEIFSKAFYEEAGKSIRGWEEAKKNKNFMLWVGVRVGFNVVGIALGSASVVGAALLTPVIGPLGGASAIMSLLSVAANSVQLIQNMDTALMPIEDYYRKAYKRYDKVCSSLKEDMENFKKRQTAYECLQNFQKAFFGKRLGNSINEAIDTLKFAKSRVMRIRYKVVQNAKRLDEFASKADKAAAEATGEEAQGITALAQKVRDLNESIDHTLRALQLVVDHCELMLANLSRIQKKAMDKNFAKAVDNFLKLTKIGLQTGLSYSAAYEAVGMATAGDTGLTASELTGAQSAAESIEATVSSSQTLAEGASQYEESVKAAAETCLSNGQHVELAGNAVFRLINQWGKDKAKDRMKPKV
ncbi:MAG: hypothetical protein AAFV53_31715 [Myxococcota bacterium]